MHTLARHKVGPMHLSQGASLAQLLGMLHLDLVPCTLGCMWYLICTGCPHPLYLVLVLISDAAAVVCQIWRCQAVKKAVLHQVSGASQAICPAPPLLSLTRMN